MTRIDRYLIAGGALIALIVSAALLGESIKHGLSYAGPFVAANPPGRWSVQQPLSDGWLVFDSATGRFCTVPNGRSASQQVNCTSAPN